ncbi:MAG TPA: hypothetical protein VFW14_03300 [Gaiellales bacterium]|nr:hypothetical protein [Gaiellales bacterium]
MEHDDDEPEPTPEHGLWARLPPEPETPAIGELISVGDRLLDTGHTLQRMQYPEVRSLGVTLQDQATTVLQLVSDLLDDLLPPAEDEEG